MQERVISANPFGQSVILLGLYEHLAFSALTRDLCDRVTDLVPATIPAIRHLWEFSALQNPAIHQLARDYAAGADVILVAMSGSEPPSHVRRLMECVLESESVRGFVAIMRCPPSAKPEDVPAYKYLSAITEQAQVPLHISSETATRQDESFQKWIR